MWRSGETPNLNVHDGALPKDSLPETPAIINSFSWLLNNNACGL